MKRSFLMSALVLGLAAGMAGCGGGAGSAEPAKDGDSAKKDDGKTGDPAGDLQNVSDGVTKDVDAAFQPLRDSDALLDSVSSLPKDLKGAKSKVDGKKVLAELKKIMDGADPALDALKLEDDAKALVQTRIDKLKALKKSLTDLPQVVTDLPGKLADAVTKGGAIVAKAVPGYKAKLSAPFGVSADDKKKAQDDMDKIQKSFDDFKGKVEGWKKEITDLPVKAKGIPDKFTKAFKG